MYNKDIHVYKIMTIFFFNLGSEDERNTYDFFNNAVREVWFSPFLIILMPTSMKKLHFFQNPLKQNSTKTPRLRK